MTEIVTTAKGQAMQVTESECRGLLVRVTNEAGTDVVANPETDIMTMGIYTSTGEELAAVLIDGREGLLSWYEGNCGYDPDTDNGAAVPILDLIKLVASHMLHQEAEAVAAKSDFQYRLESWRLLNPAKHVAALPNIFDLRDALQSVLAILHPGVVGLIHEHHGAERCNIAVEAITKAKALAAVIRG